MEGHAFRAGAAERGQAVADLLEGDAEAVLEDVDVVARLLGRVAEQPVGHQHGAGEVVGERGAHERLGLLAA